MSIVYNSARAKDVSNAILDKVADDRFLLIRLTIWRHFWQGPVCRPREGRDSNPLKGLAILCKYCPPSATEQYGNRSALSALLHGIPHRD